MKKIIKPLFVILVVLFFSGACSEKPGDRAGNEIFLPQEAVHPLEDADDLAVLLEDIGDARIVLLGESTHGTSEFYTWRAEITRRLIEEKGFDLIAVEGDWTDAYALNNYIRGKSAFSSAASALQHFDRWPAWMWKNEEIAALAEDLAAYNSAITNEEKKLGFYGLDVYGIWESLEAVDLYLREYNPAAATVSGAVSECFEKYGRNENAYARGGPEDCSEEVSELYDVVEETVGELHPDTAIGFNALQNAIVVSNAEAYYRTSGKSFAASWNIRDLHMAGTIDRLLEKPDSKIIVWEHNTHVGDARATPMADAGIVNVGQLVREQYDPGQVYIVGFGTYTGKVIAAREWGARQEIMRIPRARRASWEGLLHEQLPEDMIILMDPLKEVPGLMQPIGHRAIGVVYEEESDGYVPSVMPERYDAFIFIDRTGPLRPL